MTESMPLWAAIYLGIGVIFGFVSFWGIVHAAGGTGWAEARDIWRRYPRTVGLTFGVVCICFWPMIVLNALTGGAMSVEDRK